MLEKGWICGDEGADIKKRADLEKKWILIIRGWIRRLEGGYKNEGADL